MDTIVLRSYTPGSRRLVLTGLLHLRLADGGFCGRLLGCRPRRMPVCQGASGNVSTEDVLYMLHGLGIETVSLGFSY